MAIFNRLSKQVIEENFTHYGLFFGMVPVYLGNMDGPAPNLEVRNWVPDWTLDVAHVLFGWCCTCCYLMDPTWENPGFPIRITGEIKRG